MRGDSFAFRRIPQLVYTYSLIPKTVGTFLELRQEEDLEQLPYLQKKVANLTYGIAWLENEIKKKEYNLSALNNMTRELTYGGDEIYPMNNSTKELTYRADKIYPTIMDDKPIRLIIVVFRFFLP